MKDESLKKMSLQQMPHVHITATIETLDHYGITQLHLKTLRKDSDLAHRVARTIKGERITDESMFHRHTALEHAKFFFGISAWWVHFGVKLWDQEIPHIPKELIELLVELDPYKKNMKIGATHFLFIAPSHEERNIPYIPDYNEIQHLIKAGGRFWSFNSIYLGQKSVLKWYLMPIGDVPLTSNMDSITASEKLPKHYRQNFASTEVMKRILFLKLRPKFEFETVRTQLNQVVKYCKNSNKITVWEELNDNESKIYPIAAEFDLDIFLNLKRDK